MSRSCRGEAANCPLENNRPREHLVKMMPSFSGISRLHLPTLIVKRLAAVVHRGNDCSLRGMNAKSSHYLGTNSYSEEMRISYDTTSRANSSHPPVTSSPSCALSLGAEGRLDAFPRSVGI